ncbi:MAG TPA: proton-conducting transporter membrane subunit [Candidatus Eisenbacteria bacterium]|nr:proton-conducting transporter membrane subunit [Candidatus Eisenbacteria bacterium]
MSALSGAALVLFYLLCALGLIMSVLFRGKYGSLAIAWFGTLCSITMMGAAGLRLASGVDSHLNLWTLNGFGTLSLHLDALSAIFLFTGGLIYFSCCIFAPDYLAHYTKERYSAGSYAVLHFGLMASVVSILTAGDGLTFLIAWECMSILCYLLVNYEQEPDADLSAGYIMLAMSEAGFLAIVIAFLIAAHVAGGYSFAMLRAAHFSHVALWGVFLLGFFGFGVKAGLVPVNFWLPRSYTASPSIFIPVFAGVTLNLGFYGILRLNADLAPPSGVGPGVLALVVGAVTALVGILYATTENDLKKMLAHSSIENAGIIVAGIGAFLVFRNSGNAIPAALALTAALYHMLNHSTYKALLYQGAGNIEAATGTRDMDQLGGLIRSMPALSVVFLAGCLAIAAVPPFNGFVSEWLTLQTFLRSALLSSPAVKIVFALSGAILALTAALAVTCFVKTYAMSFLGIPRSSWSFNGSEFSRKPRFSLTLLAVACILLGVLPTYVIPALNLAVEPLAGSSASASLIPPFFTATEANRQLPPAFVADFNNLGAQTGAHWLPGRGLVILLRGGEQNPVVFAMSPSYSIIALGILLFVTWFIITRLTRRRAVVKSEVWAGGIPNLLPEMTYTATGFSNPVRVVFQAIFRPNIVEDTRETVAVHFRTAIRRRRDETHLVDRLFFHPVGASVNAAAKLLAGMHHGKLNAYVAYVIGFLILVLFLYRVT